GRYCENRRFRRAYGPRQARNLLIFWHRRGKFPNWPNRERNRSNRQVNRPITELNWLCSELTRPAETQEFSRSPRNSDVGLVAGSWFASRSRTALWRS